jgi:hypothetical protein
LRRRREVALRLALGVSRGRLAAKTLTESLVLALIGCALGVVVAQVGGQVLSRLFLPEWVTFSLLGDTRTLLVAIAAALLAALVTGVVPALLATRADLAVALKAGSREGTYQRSRTARGAARRPGALSVLLLVGAGLFVRSLNRVRAMRLGFDTDRIILLRHELRGTALGDSESVGLSRQLLQAAQAMPVVEHASFVSSVPFWSTSSTRLYVPGIDSVQRWDDSRTRKRRRTTSPRWEREFFADVRSARRIAPARRVWPS